MTISGHAGVAGPVEQAHSRSPPPPPPPPLQTKNMASACASQRGGSYISAAARHLEESRDALAWSLGRPIEAPFSAATSTSYLQIQPANAARLACTTAATTCSASCTPSSAAPPLPSENITTTLSEPDLRPPLMCRARRAPSAAAGSPLLRQALHAADPLRGLTAPTVRARYAAWARAQQRQRARLAWVLEHGACSSASSSDEDEEDAFGLSMGAAWDGILDAYEDEQMGGWGHWSGWKLQPDELLDEYC